MSFALNASAACWATWQPLKAIRAERIAFTERVLRKGEVTIGATGLDGGEKHYTKLPLITPMV